MDIAKCELCGEPMPPGEEMFKFHGYTGPCPKPPLPKHFPQKVADKSKELPMRLYDRADGVRGHFCIGRPMDLKNQDYSEFWNEDASRWSSAGTVYTTRESAEKRMAELMQVTHDEALLASQPKKRAVIKTGKRTG